MLRNHLPTTFTRRQLLQGIAALSGSTLLSGCNAVVSSGATPASPQVTTDPQPVPPGTLTRASLTVSDTSVGTIGAGFAGLSYEKSALSQPLFSGSNDQLVGLFKRLGPSVLRIGGNSVDEYVWTPSGRGRTAGQVAPSDIAALAAFVKEVGWQCIYGINLGGDATGATSPALAAAEAAYAAQQFGSSLLGIEIGNECDGYGASGSYFADSWSLTRFQSLWLQYRDAIVLATPTIAIVGPDSGSNVSSWTVPFGQAMGKSNLSLLTQHYYRGDGKSSNATVANLLAPDQNLINCAGLLQAGSQSIGVPYRFTECNSYFNGGAPGISNSYASALWVIDFLFNCAKGGAAGVNLHGGGNWTGYTPIADSSGIVSEARPEYYGILFFTLAGQGTILDSQLSAGSLNATAYAVRTPTGTNVVIINKDATQSLDLSVFLPQAATTATLTALTQSTAGSATPSVTATTGVTIQGGTVHPDGTFSPSAGFSLSVSGSRLECYVPALSAALIQIS